MLVWFEIGIVVLLGAVGVWWCLGRPRIGTPRRPGNGTTRNRVLPGADRRSRIAPPTARHQRAYNPHGRSSLDEPVDL
jgi:hypothetical protein